MRWLWWSILAGASEVAEPDWALTHRWAEPDAYFEGGARPLLDPGATSLDYDVSDVRAVLYVPDGEPPDGGWSLYLHIDADDRANLPPDWRALISEQRMIYVAPHGAGNDTPVPLRIAWSLDALASVEASWPVHPRRRVIGGFSGGGATAVTVAAHWPEVFVGAVDLCRAVMWEEHAISTMPGYAFGMGEVDHLDPDWLPSLVDGPRFAFVSGDQDWLGDFSNYEGMMDGLGDWWARGIRARVLDVPGLGHQPAPAGVLQEALSWVLDCTDTGRFPPRFGTDHMPPATPFPAPEVAAPEACDPPSPDPVVKPPDEARSCGCSASSSGSGGWILLVALSQVCWGGVLGAGTFSGLRSLDPGSGEQSPDPPSLTPSQARATARSCAAARPPAS